MTDPAEPLLAVTELSKTFAAKVLDGVSLAVRPGEVLAVLGQNGSGKSTLVKVLAGVHHADPGSRVTLAAGTEMHFIHQDLGLVGDLTTVENLDLGRKLSRRDMRPSRRIRETRAAEALVARFGGGFDVHLPVAQLSPAERTIVAIARSMSGWTHPRHVLVLDEPTASLHGTEVSRLFDAVRRVADEGAGVLFITHRLDEVFSLADRAIFLRDGRITAERDVVDLDEESLIELITGEKGRSRARARPPIGEVVLEVQGTPGSVFGIAGLAVRAGEVVGITGVVGSGAGTILKSIFGVEPLTGTHLRVDGEAVRSGSIRASRRAGLGLVPGDRLSEAAFPMLDVRENISIAHLAPLRGRLGYIRPRTERASAREWMRRLNVRPNDHGRPLGQLSGGNQQKVILARSLNTGPGVLLLEEPTQGVDVGAKGEIYRLIDEIAGSGCAVLLASSDTREIAEVCDRALVVRDGVVAGEVPGRDLSEARLLAESLGAVRSSDQPDQESHHVS